MSWELSAPHLRLSDLPVPPAKHPLSPMCKELLDEHPGGMHLKCKLTYDEPMGSFGQEVSSPYQSWERVKDAEWYQPPE